MMHLNFVRTVLWACILLAPISVSLGGFSVGLHVAVIMVAAIYSAARHGTPRINSAAALLVFGGAMALHFVVANILSPCIDSFLKSVLSFVLFAGISLSLVQLAARSHSFDLEKDLRILVGLICASVITEQIWLRATGVSGLIRASGIFLEPSHLALSVSPLLVGLIFATRTSDRWWGWITTLTLLILAASSTLFILVTACLLATLFATSRRRVSAKGVFRIILSVTAFGMLVYASPYREEFVARVSGVAKTDIEANISSIVYVNGWETAGQNLTNTHGLGLGFNRMGCNPRPRTDSGDFLEAFDLNNINLNDGSFTIAKVLSELGIFGAVVWTLAGYLLVRMIREARHFKTDPRIFVALSVSAGVVLIFGGFVRGTGYFSGPFLLGYFFILLSAVRRSARHRRIQSAREYGR